ncbi:MAG: copper chaperone PCu(A)C, partial [Parvularculaceae bacterium]|nr:copper chaperone PCu(A)C [Parvularculaceae bacterium]
SLSLSAAQAHEYDKGGIKVDHPWARPTLSNTTPAAAYLIIDNKSTEDDTLLSAVVGTDIAAHTELHQTSTVEGVSRMRVHLGGMTVPAGGQLRFEPAGRHIMLIGLEQRLQEGKTFPLTLNFENAGAIEVIVYIETPVGQEAVNHDHH